MLMIFAVEQKGELMRLIDADALERDGWYLCRNVQVDKHTMEYQTKKPTFFTTMEVVQCKDCKYKNSHIYKNAYTCDRFKGNVFIVDDDYCSYAERRIE